MNGSSSDSIFKNHVLNLNHIWLSKQRTATVHVSVHLDTMVSSLHRSWFSPPNTAALFSPTPHRRNHPSWLCLSSNVEHSEPIDSQSQGVVPESTQNSIDPVKLAFKKAEEYKKSPKINTGLAKAKPQDDDSVKISVEKDVNYEEDQVGAGFGVEDGQGGEKGLTSENDIDLTNKAVDKREPKKESLKISSIDFLGLDFADKKRTRGLPPGLVPPVDSFPEEDFLEVEIIVGDASKFGQATASEPKPTTEEFYKPKVSTWGVFPRPNDISKTFGGGRTIRPGDVIETREVRAAKEKRTRELLAAYKKKVGLSIDPKLRSECEKALKDGDALMNAGKLKEAIPCYEKVMKQMVFESELHGLAALQWSICQDSLNRLNEARPMYEKLRSHPTSKIRKQAKQFIFSFKAMEVMKVNRGSNPFLKNTGYQDYFEAFVEDKPNYSLEADEFNSDALSQALPYLIFLVSPVFMVLFISIQKGYAN